VEKCGRAGQATDDNIILRMRYVLVCWMTDATDTFRVCNTSLPLHGKIGYVNATLCCVIVHRPLLDNVRSLAMY
jgi:hypothetical protein